VLGVLTLVYFGLQRVGGMSDRIFALTLDGANGLVRYLVGDYIGAACAYRAHYGCGIGSCGVPRPSLAHYVTGMGPMDGATAAGGRSCCLSSRSNRCDKLVRMITQFLVQLLWLSFLFQNQKPDVG